MRAPILTFKRAKTLRRKMSLPEVVLWQKIRNEQLNGLAFRRQHPVGPYILDFFCARARLAIEVDGAVHDHPDHSQHDKRRDAWLASRNIRVLRFAASDILKAESLDNVLSAIVRAAAPSTAFGGPPPPLRGGGT